MNVNRRRAAAFKDKDLSHRGQLQQSRPRRGTPSYPPHAAGGGRAFICRCRYGLRGFGGDAWDVVLSCRSAHGLRGDVYLMAPYNPHKYPCMASCTPLNFEALQWITLRNRVGNLSALNLNSASIKGTFSLLLEDVIFSPSLSFFKVWIISRRCRRGWNLVHQALECSPPPLSP